MPLIEVDTNEDGNMTLAPACCECAAWSGEHCSWEGDRSETVLVEFMPTHLRASHAAAGNSGIYPHNGAQRNRCALSCAEVMIESDGNWCSIVGEA